MQTLLIAEFQKQSGVYLVVNYPLYNAAVNSAQYRK